MERLRTHLLVPLTLTLTLAAYAPARDLLREWHEHEQHPYVRARLEQELRPE